MTTENELLTAKVGELIESKVRELGLYLEKLLIKGSKNTRIVEVYLDLPDGTDSLGSERLEEASREISALLDAQDPIEGAYNLEVSTLGAEHELDNPRLFARAVGKDAEVKAKGEIRQGVIKDAGGEGFTLEIDGKQETIGFGELESARTVILFGTNKKTGKSKKK